MARRGTAWFGKALEYVTLGTGVTVIQFVSDTLLHGTAESPTVIRMIGRLWAGYERSDGGFQESQRSDFYFGISCQHSDITGQSPRLEPDAEHWMWTSYFYSESTFMEFPDWTFDSNVIIGGTTESRGTQHIGGYAEILEFDSRAMRKAPEPCEINLSVDVQERLSETGASHKISGLIRILVKT